MQNLALYRKYRPKTFKEIKGQDHIVELLSSSIENNNVSHAYLFVGSRGTGKTSVARIFAEQIGVSRNDLYEIDAASNRGIEDIKELREGIRVLPFDSKYKIYIIDEVHMLSKDAWGALLKTLEEPPRHVIFILATTEFHKVPETIISRCQVFNFKKANESILKKLIEDIAKKEGFLLEAGVSDLLSILGDGSFRDGLGILQKVLNSNLSLDKNKKIEKKDVEKITGAPKTTLVNDLILAIGSNKLEEAITVVQKVSNENLDIKLYLKLIIFKFRMAIILRYAPKLENNMKGDLSEDDLNFLKSLILNKETKNGIMFNSKNLAILLYAYQNIENAFIKELPLELALISILGENQ